MVFPYENVVRVASQRNKSRTSFSAVTASASTLCASSLTGGPSVVNTCRLLRLPLRAKLKEEMIYSGNMNIPGGIRWTDHKRFRVSRRRAGYQSSLLDAPPGIEGDV